MNNWKKVIEIQNNITKGINDKGKELELKDYYSINEIMNILDIKTRSIIFYWIEKGKVKDFKKLPFGKKFRYFISKKEINSIKDNKEITGRYF